MNDHQTILVVDDEPTVLDSLADVLRLSGYRVLAAMHGLEALSILQSTLPDLIVADVMMPRMNGYQLYHRVRSNPDWNWIPFIFLTAKGEPEDVRYGKEVGADDYLSKPIEPEDLVAAVAGRLERYRQLRQGAQPPARERIGGKYRVGDHLVVDLSSHCVAVGAAEVSLSPTEFAILSRLILADTAVLDYEDLLGYEEGQVLDERDAAELLRYHIRNLRQKLKEAGGDPNLIVNVRRTGYRIAARPVRLLG